MKTTMLTLKIDPTVKKEAGKIAEDFGISLSSIINASLKELIRHKTLSYSLMTPNTKTQKHILESRKLRENHKAQTFTSASAMIDSLNS